MDRQNLPAPLPDAGTLAPRFAFADVMDDYEEPKKGPGLQRYVRAVLRYKWLVLVLMIVGGGAGYFASKLITPIYTAQGVLWLQTTDRESAQEGPIRSAQLLRDGAWLELLRAVPVLDPVVREHRLFARYAHDDRDLMTGLQIDSAVVSGRYRLMVSAAGDQVELRNDQGIVVDRAAPGQPIGSALGIIWTPDGRLLRPGREVEFTVARPTAAAGRLASELRVAMPQRSNFISVAYDNPDPEKAAGIVNSIAQSFVGVATDLKRVHLVETRKILQEQLSYARANLDAAEFELNSFMIRTATLPTSPTTPLQPGTQENRTETMNSFFSLRVQRDQLIRDRAAVERAMAAGNEAVAVEALSSVAAVQQSPEMSRALEEVTAKRAEVRGLLMRFTPEHPSVSRAREELDTLERSVLPRMARTLMTELSNRIGVLDGMVNSAAGELQDIPPRVIAEAGLRRAVASAETLHNNLLQRFENARLAAETTMPDVSVLTPASVPQQPNSDLRLQVLLLGLAGGLGLGIGIAILLELLDKRIRYADQVSDGLKLPILGALPDMSPKRGLFASARDRGELVEALRGIRLNLAHAYGAAGPIMLTVTSPGPGDGKTFLTSNLAVTFAELGMRTLVVDADTRRGTLHHALRIERKPGLVDFLSRSAALEDVVRRSTVPGLDVITCGRRLSLSPDLLSSSAMGDLLAFARGNYDVVLFDSPPLGAGVDPLVLATAMGNVLLVMRAGKTNRALAEAKLAILDRLPIRKLGAVLNGIDESHSYKYYSYSADYAPSEEPESAPRSLQPA